MQLRAVLVVNLFAASAFADPGADAPGTSAPPAEQAVAARTEGKPAVTLPKLLSPIEPQYPPTGTTDARVIVHVTLDAAGAVTHVDLKEGSEPFATAALRAVERAHFSPATKNGVAVPAKISIAVEFTYALKEAPPATGAQPAADAAKLAATPASGVNPAAAPAETPEEIPVEITVTAPRLDDTERGINRAEARMTAGTFGDPLRAVELLPGVTPLISGVPYFFVRGAPAGSVSFYVDEAPVPQLYHVGPGSAVLHPQFVDGVALHAGPYRARYGNATSGVVTARAVSALDAAAAEVEVKVFESGAYVGLPFANGQGAAAFAGKVSHLGPVLALVNPELRLNYWDYQSMVAYSPTPRDRVSALVFGASDFVGQMKNGTVDTNIDSVFHRLKLGYDRNLGPGLDLHNTVIVGTDRTRFAAHNERMSDRSLAATVSLHRVQDRIWEWAGGVQFEAVDYDARGASGFPPESNAAVSRVDSQVAVYGELRYSPLSSVHLDAGLRGVRYQSKAAQAFSVEPRLTSTLDWTEHFKSILAVGLATQTPSAAVPSPGVRPAELRGGLQRALQRSLTFRYAVPLEFTAEATGFYNDYFSLSDPLSLSTIADPLGVGDTSGGREPPQENLRFAERPNGRAYGLELLLRRPFTNALSGTVAYTLSRSTRRVGSQDFPSSFDRTHLLNVTAGYDFGYGINLGVRMLTYTGLPVREFGVVGAQGGRRTDPFLRLDARLSKEWQLSWGDLMLIVELENATFQKEVLGTTCSAAGCVTATFGPVTVPSIGLRGSFGGARSAKRVGSGYTR